MSGFNLEGSRDLNKSGSTQMFGLGERHLNISWGLLCNVDLSNDKMFSKF